MPGVDTSEVDIRPSVVFERDLRTAAASAFELGQRERGVTGIIASLRLA